MAVKVAINGFGRIGRNVARAILERSDHDLELVSINDLGDAKANARLLRHDSVHGAFNGSVEVDGNALIIKGKRIQVTAERDPATSTGAAVAVGLVLPELKGKLDGSSIRVPTPNVSVVDLTFTPLRDTTKEEVNAVLKAAAEGPLKGVLGYTEEPLVSIDFNHEPASSTIDSLETSVIDGTLVRVLSWYDNEWGFSNRMIDTAGVVAKFL